MPPALERDADFFDTRASSMSANIFEELSLMGDGIVIGV